MAGAELRRPSRMGIPRRDRILRRRLQRNVPALRDGPSRSATRCTPDEHPSVEARFFILRYVESRQHNGAKIKRERSQRRGTVLLYGPEVRKFASLVVAEDEQPLSFAVSGEIGLLCGSFSRKTAPRRTLYP